MARASKGPNKKTQKIAKKVDKKVIKRNKDKMIDFDIKEDLEGFFTTDGAYKWSCEKIDVFFDSLLK
ncbi:hypothetical protein EDEG_03715 [Edhazardia aedis USNM 41457]|uniref:Apoptosis-antagonizing transcription factor C-terminal domain-containing protein n=1 Tax=Edhazardia aedis (strain USNM 41457) TaxID=1003232 RepID=J8ZQ27_EDHAE|nr:hypothetical protein EDEG_03715 [Edhazardia aedis USNM 41457]|eukprot:EJW01798.1 hypothetical protein EDEG_03715 [Edhazardia aedis USNM 41457]